LEDETGLTNVHLEQMHTFGKCGRDPRGRQITVAYMGIGWLAREDKLSFTETQRGISISIKK